MSRNRVAFATAQTRVISRHGGDEWEQFDDGKIRVSTSIADRVNYQRNAKPRPSTEFTIDGPPDKALRSLESAFAEQFGGNILGRVRADQINWTYAERVEWLCSVLFRGHLPFNEAPSPERYNVSLEGRMRRLTDLAFAHRVYKVMKSYKWPADCENRLGLTTIGQRWDQPNLEGLDRLWYLLSGKKAPRHVDWRIAFSSRVGREHATALTRQIKSVADLERFGPIEFHAAMKRRMGKRNDC